MARRKNDYWSNDWLNKLSYSMYFNRLAEMAQARFKWHNLPETVNSRFMELCLFRDGQCVYFNDPIIGNVALRCTISAPLNVYNEPTMRRAYASNGYNRQLSESDSVLIYNNNMHTNSVAMIDHYAKRLWDLDRTIDVNCRAQKTPVFIVCDDKQLLSMKNLYEKYDGNAPVIYGESALSANPIKALKTDAPFVADKIQELKVNIWNEAMTYLGISNVAIEKRERVQTDEVNRSLGGTIASRYSALDARNQAAEKINAMFGTNIYVTFQEDEISGNDNTSDDDFEEVIEDE